MASRLIAVTLVALAVAGARPSAGAVTAWTDVHIRVFGAAGLAPSVRRAALAAAGDALASASLEPIWLDCSDRPAPDACRVPPRPGELSIRIVRQSPAAASRGGVPLGEALIDRETASGVLATIYYDRVHGLADAARSEVAPLLGRAIAHEVGHLLMATTGHSRRGLMRAVWSMEEVRRNRTEDWRFLPAEAEAMIARYAPGLPRRSSSPRTIASAISFFVFRR